MYMIFYAADAITFASRVSGYGREVRMNRLLNGFVEIGASAFCAENQMDDYNAQ
jgi:hypothetical protein